METELAEVNRLSKPGHVNQSTETVGLVVQLGLYVLFIQNNIYS